VAATLPRATAVEEEERMLPQGLALGPNYPNPFNSSTIIPFSVGARQEVELAVYNLAGQQMAILIKEVRQASPQAVRWEGRDGRGQALASGVYLCGLRAGAQEAWAKVVLLR
jgi:hypothetical protein